MKWISSTLLLFGLSIQLMAYADNQWQMIMPGIKYTSIDQGILKRSPKVIAFKINPKQYSFDILTAKTLTTSDTAYVAKLGKLANALIAINGGYFSQNQKPLGLRISQYKKISNKKNISWWGVFYLQGNTPRITSSRGFSYNASIPFAIQAGPRLIVNGRIPNLKPGVAQRSAIAITRNKKVIIAITQGYPLTLKEWAKVLKSLGCYNALNLDGGTSSQLYVNLETLQVVVPNYKSVTDAVAVLKKS